jgi:2-dehydro-3-deoxygluconokinase
MFALDSAQKAMYEAEWAELFYFSLISLAILPPEGRQRLLDLALCVQANGGTIAFDGNYRPHLWASIEDARQARDDAIAVADIGLPTLDDETALSGETSADSVASHWRRLNCEEALVKLGDKGCRLPDGRIVAPEQVLRPVDTSGAGDAFNAGYLDARLKGVPVAEAARAGQALAGWTIMRPGAIPPRDS